MKVIAIIPARSGSKGVPGKNIKILGTKPLLQYTAESAKKSSLLTDIIISTDSQEIASLARKCGIEVPFIRPSALATDTASSIDLVIHAVNFLEQQGRSYDAVCLLQPTSPFRKKGFIDEAIGKFIDTGSDSLISVLPLHEKYNPHWIFEKQDDNLLKIATGEKEIIKRRQDLPDAFYRDGSIYITKTTVINNLRSLYGGSISFIISDQTDNVNIDTLKDWELAEATALKFNRIID